MPASSSAAEEARPLLGLDVLSWRYKCLEDAGFPVEAAIMLAENIEVDLHVAVRLLERGCSVEQAVAILA